MKEEKKIQSEVTEIYTEFEAEFLEDDYVSEVTKAIKEAYSQYNIDR